MQPPGGVRRLGGLTTDNLFLLGLLAISLSLNVYLAVRLRLHPSAFNGQAARIQGASALQRGGPFSKSKIEVRRSDGHVGALQLNTDRPTIVYVFAPTCSWCQRNKAAVNDLAIRTRPRYSFVALALEETGVKEFLAGTPLQQSAASLVNADDKVRLSLGGIPQTLVVSETGVVLERWPGAYIAETKDAVERYFQTSLHRVE